MPLDPLSLVTGMLGGGKGSSQKVSQSTSVSSSSALSLSISNLIGSGATGPTSAGTSTTQSPLASVSDNAPRPASVIPTYSNTLEGGLDNQVLSGATGRMPSWVLFAGVGVLALAGIAFFARGRR